MGVFSNIDNIEKKIGTEAFTWEDIFNVVRPEFIKGLNMNLLWFEDAGDTMVNFYVEAAINALNKYIPDYYKNLYQEICDETHVYSVYIIQLYVHGETDKIWLEGNDSGYRCKRDEDRENWIWFSLGGWSIDVSRKVMELILYLTDLITKHNTI